MTTAPDGPVKSYADPVIGTTVDVNGQVESYNVKFSGQTDWDAWPAEEWITEVRFFPRLPPLPARTLALVDGAVWCRSETKWYPVAGLGICLCPLTDAQVRAKGKPLTAGEWSGA